MEMAQIMDSFYMDHSPVTSDFGDLDSTDYGTGWSPVSTFSDQENFPAMFETNMTTHDLPMTSQRCYDQSHLMLQPSQQQYLQPEDICNENIISISGSSPLSTPIARKFPSRHPVKRVYQRNAANQRERKRMKIINDAFDGLRNRIPLETAERKLSKVDTLRLAIQYIQHLSGLVECSGASGATGGCGQSSTANRVVIRCNSQPGFPDELEDLAEPYPLYGHALSWENNKQPALGPDNKLAAKLWVPETPTSEDVANLTEISPATS